jgi:hypothetical protein
MAAEFVIFPILFVVGILVVILIRVAAGSMDHSRIREYIERQGGEVLQSSWAPFGPGWFGEKTARLYAVRYLDRDGNEHEANCKTSLWTGVYFTDDRIVRYAERSDERVDSLEEENRRLREELQRIKGSRAIREP